LTRALRVHTLYGLRGIPRALPAGFEYKASYRALLRTTAQRNNDPELGP
jgi:hypothetical protein